MAQKISIQIPASGAPSSASDVAPGGTVKFSNKAGASVHIDFGDKSPFCPQKTDYSLGAGKSRTLDVCANYGISGTYAYASTVTGGQAQNATLKVTALVPPDPIVFPEKKPIVFPEVWIALLVGLAFGAVIGLLVAKRRLTRNPRPN